MDKRYEQIETLLESLEDSIENATNALKVQESIEEILTPLFTADHAVLWGNDDPYLFNVRAKGTRKLSLEQKRGLLYRCFLTKEPAIYNALPSERDFEPAVDDPDGENICSIIFFPLIVRDELVGIFTLYTTDSKRRMFRTDDVELLRHLQSPLIDALYKILILTERPIPIDRRQRSREDFQAKETRQYGPAVFRGAGSREDVVQYFTRIMQNLRNPVENLMEFLQFLQARVRDERLQDPLFNAVQSARIVDEYIEEILESIHQSKNAPKIEDEIHTLKYFSRIAEIFSGRIHDKRITYLVNIDPMLPKTVNIEQRKLRKVLINLLDNAVKFTPPEGIIEFSVRYLPEKSSLSIAVADTGMGISEEQQKEIFTLFPEQSQNEGSFGRHGFGLPISAAIVEELGGRLRLKSIKKKGSRFEFELPLSGIGEIETMPQIDPQTRRITILNDRTGDPIVKLFLRFIQKLGIQRRHIRIIEDPGEIPAATTHLIVFQRHWNERLLSLSRELNMKLLLVEESYLSIDPKEYPSIPIVSQYAYFGKDLLDFLGDEHPLKILIADDDLLSVSMLRKILDHEYCEIVTVQDGKEALRLLTESLMAETPYQILYTSLQLPELQGDEILQRYRRLESEHSVDDPLQAVCLSGTPTKEESKIFDDYLKRPYAKEAVLAPFRRCQERLRSKKR